MHVVFDTVLPHTEAVLESFNELLYPLQEDFQLLPKPHLNFRHAVAQYFKVILPRKTCQKSSPSFWRVTVTSGAPKPNLVTAFHMKETQKPGLYKYI